MSQLPPAPALSAAAFAELLERTQLRVFHVLRHLLGNDEEARDSTQEVFVAAWLATQRQSPPFTEAGTLEQRRGWLMHAAYNQAITILRRRRIIRWQSLDDMRSGEEEPMDWAVAERDAIPFEEQIVAGEEVHSLLSSLAPQDAACLVLKLLQGYSAVEMAQILDITPEAARKRLSRAVQRLRAVYVARQAETTGGAPTEPSLVEHGEGGDR